jgi:hypothetical protein
MAQYVRGDDGADGTTDMGMSSCERISFHSLPFCWLAEYYLRAEYETIGKMLAVPLHERAASQRISNFIF